MDKWNAEEQRVLYKENTHENTSKVIGWENSPRHCHDIPGLWDWDNRLKAGTVCEECELHNIKLRHSKFETWLSDPRYPLRGVAVGIMIAFSLATIVTLVVSS